MSGLADGVEGGVVDCHAVVVRDDSISRGVGADEVFQQRGMVGVLIDDDPSWYRLEIR